MITIIIFSSNRFDYLSELIKDIKKCNLKIKNKIILVSYNESKTNIKKIKKIIKENYFVHYIEKKNLSFGQKLKKYSKKVKTEFFWHLSDDDRIKYNSIEEINTLLKKNKKNLLGITINHDFLKNIKKITYKNKKKEIKLENFDIVRNVHRLGMNSAQIYKTKEFVCFKQPNKKYFNDAYFHVGIISKLLFVKKKWRYVNKKLIIYRYSNIDEKKKLNILNRLDDEFKGYFKPIKYYSKENYSRIFKQVFYVNIVSWIFLNFKINGKIETYKVILKNFNFFPVNPKYILILLLIFIVPFSFFKFIRKKINKITLQ